MKTCDYCGHPVSSPCGSMDHAAGCSNLGSSPFGNVPLIPVAHKPSLAGFGAMWSEDIEAVSKNDAVHQPKHYARWKMQPIEFIAMNDLPFWLANLIKYSMRYDAKDGLQDLYKGRSYLDMKIRQLEGHTRFWEKPVAVERVLNGD